MPSLGFQRTLERIMKWRGKPAMIRGDNGPEYVSNQLVTWAIKYKITLIYIQPDKPTENAYIERFNHTALHEWLDIHEFESVAHSKDVPTK